MASLSDLRTTTPDGRLPAYAWPGGYPILYVTAGGAVVCPDCANGDSTDPVVASEVYWEGAPVPCDDCGKPIESAYGDPDIENPDDPGDDGSSCPACGGVIDYCAGHGEIGDPTGAATLARHDDSDHTSCDPLGCDDARTVVVA